jgi:hypothetical protein
MTICDNHDHTVYLDGAVVPHTRQCPADDGTEVNITVGGTFQVIPVDQLPAAVRLIAEAIATAQGFPSWASRQRAMADPKRMHAVRVARLSGRVLAGPDEGVDVVAWCARQRADVDEARWEADKDGAKTAVDVATELWHHIADLDPTWDSFANRPWPTGTGHGCAISGGPPCGVRRGR